ncbi:MAG: peptide-methionine (S)-S-oxide reductase MsrA [Acidobacteriaceae bacterium]|nr:peptide-methionine (S)-S-oxide reductase MsrA [Acidobacteriaceae bacterium]
MAATEIATLGGGCFWCLEAVFDRMKGVLSVESGYMGGHVADPSYEAVCMGTTGHAEVVRITFDPAQVTFQDILHVFFAIHDPTTLNRQGNDVGTQYRSAIFYHSPEQLAAARERIAAFEEPESVVTEVTPAVIFYEAEAYHQEYFARNPHAGYCQYVVRPKVEKFHRYFAEWTR